MSNITISILGKLYKKMKKYSEIKWSTAIRKSLEKYLMQLVGKYEMCIRELLEEPGIENELAQISDEIT